VRRKASLITAHGQSPYFFPLDRRDRSERILSLVANKRATCPPTLPPCPPPPPPLPPLPRLVPPLSASCVFTVSLVYPADISPPPRSAPPLSLSLSLSVCVSFFPGEFNLERPREAARNPPAEISTRGRTRSRSIERSIDAHDEEAQQPVARNRAT
jgi:hypothetical protein